LPLAREIQACVAGCPGTNIFVLGNHGLVICGDTCNACDSLLGEVERRLTVSPRYSPQPDYALLRQITAGSRWRLPDTESVHSLANDAISRYVVSAGVLYPCQAIFLGGRASVVPPHQRDLASRFAETENLPPFLIIAGAGVVVSDRITRAERQMLIGLSEVAARIDSSAPIRYLSPAELASVMTEDTQRYRQLAAINNAAVASV
jgi:rhamnose utilization protein RhaD (predicted bifunctional aldolase and dehydrogenase)